MKSIVATALALALAGCTTANEPVKTGDDVDNGNETDTTYVPDTDRDTYIGETSDPNGGGNPGGGNPGGGNPGGGTPGGGTPGGGGPGGGLGTGLPGIPSGLGGLGSGLGGLGSGLGGLGSGLGGGLGGSGNPFGGDSTDTAAGWFSAIAPSTPVLPLGPQPGALYTFP